MTPASRLLSWVLALALAGCGGGGAAATPTGGGGGGGGGAPATVDESLERLGVQMKDTPRLNSDGQLLPADWSPLGPSSAVNRVHELVVVGVTDEGSTNLYGWEDFGVNDPDNFRPMRDFDGEAWGRALLRIPVAGDFDGDGIEELLFLNQQDDESDVYADLHDDDLAGYAPLARIVASTARPTRFTGIAADFDGDGRDEAAIALVFRDRAEISFLDYEGGVLSATGRTIRIDGIQDARRVVTFATGQLDEDPARELALVCNERFDRETSVTFDLYFRDGRARYFVYDDANGDFEEIAAGEVAATPDGTPRTAKAADLALADIDADGFDEVVLGGLTKFGAPDASAGTSMGYLLVALDDPGRGFGLMDARFEPYVTPNTTLGAHWLEHAHLEAADLDGDAVVEILLSHLLFAWRDGAWSPLVPDLAKDVREEAGLGSLPLTQVVFPDATRRVHHSQEKTHAVRIRLIDRTRDNILTWSHELGGGVLVWGLVNGAIVLEDSLPATYVEALVPADIDADSLALSYVEGSHRLLFTEPVIVAVLAAAPCGEGQDPDDCRTAFGFAESSGAETERALSMTAGVSVGVAVDANTPFLSLAGEDVFTISETVEHSTSSAYEVTQTVLWETGPAEDSVIFTSLPYDQYRYRIVQPGLDAGLRGREVLVSVPRRPVSLMVSRAFYDANVVAGGARVDPAAMPHTPGDPLSYFTEEEADALVLAHGGIATAPRDVGEGSGSISVILEVGLATTQGRSITSSWNADVRATIGGVVAGFSVGESETASLRLTTGRRTLYGGQVGQIDAAHVADHSFSFGLFAYPHRDAESGRSYQVLQYWVTPAR